MKFEVTEEEIKTALIKEIPHVYNLKVIKRQFEIENGSGRVDILTKHIDNLGYGKDLYCVIEVKAGAITPLSVIQVLRYTQWLNAEYSKNGKRYFYPLIIGNYLEADESEHLLRLLKPYNNFWKGEFVCYYDLFKLKPSLGYYNVKNGHYIAEKYKKGFSLVDSWVQSYSDGYKDAEKELNNGKDNNN